jgi:hypothetical protein
MPFFNKYFNFLKKNYKYFKFFINKNRISKRYNMHLLGINT